MTSTSDGPLSDAEYRQLAVLLHRYASNDMDQWEAWRFTTPWGVMSALLRMGLQPGVPDEAHIDLDSVIQPPP